MKRTLLTLFILAAFFSRADTIDEAQKVRSLKVGVTHAPPFMILDSNSMTGLCIDLWGEVADSLGIQYTCTRFNDYASLLDGLRDNMVDVVINPVSLTDKRLRNYRLSIPFYVSDMGIATNQSFRIPLISAFVHLLNWRTIRMSLVLLSVVFVFSVLIWLFEHRINSGQFRKGHKGIADGIWWAFVTMSTVGYGDKVPKSKMGRLLTIFWVTYAVSLFFVFTAEVSSELTITKMQSDIAGFEGLRKVKVGTLEESGYASLLKVNHVKYIPYHTLTEGLQALDSKHVDAFIGDAGTLSYNLEKLELGKDIEITRTSVRDQYFCLAARKDNTGLIDEINPVLLNITESQNWDRVLDRYDMTE